MACRKLLVLLSMIECIFDVRSWISILDLHDSRPLVDLVQVKAS